MSSDLESELAGILNRYSMEAGSNTPDFVLAGFLIYALHAFEHATRQRDKWYGISPEPGKGETPVKAEHHD